MAATHDNLFYAKFLNVKASIVEAWLKKHKPPYELDGVKKDIVFDKFYEETQHNTEIWFRVPDEELSVVAVAQIEAWCTARMGIDCGFEVEMF